MRRYKRKLIAEVQYALTLPKWMNEARRHPNWPAMKKDWQEKHKMFMLHETMTLRPPIILDEANSEVDRIIAKLPKPEIIVPGNGLHIVVGSIAE